MKLAEWLGEKKNQPRHDWMLLRCELQYDPIEDDLDEENGKRLLDEFCLWFDNEHKQFAEKLNDSKNVINQLFQVYLSKNLPVEAIVNDQWGENGATAKKMIDYISSYRDSGVLDTNIVDELMSYAKYINNDPLRYIYELIQNADDCEYDVESPEVEIKILKDKMSISYPEKGMTRFDILAITTLGESNKTKKKKTDM